jgi:hypothetical protein
MVSSVQGLSGAVLALCSRCLPPRRNQRRGVGVANFSMWLLVWVASWLLSVSMVVVNCCDVARHDCVWELVLGWLTACAANSFAAVVNA